MAIAMLDLWRRGGGLPMNAFPPPHLVKQGAFRFIPHPIYTGFVLACFGVSMICRSAAGLWLVTPAVALGCTALVLGYERIDMLRRLGNVVHILPENDDARPTGLDWVHYLVCVLLPWLALYELTIRMRIPGTAFALPFEHGLPIWAWTSPVYQSIYAFAVLAPWVARTRRDLRKLTISVWFATAVIFPFYWIVPSAAPRRPLSGDVLFSGLLHIEREADAPVAAFPSFHVLWAIFVARLFRRRWLGISYAVAVAASCVTTGMHYIPDLLASFAIAPAFVYPERVWASLRRLAERIANSWTEWRIGPVRIIYYGVYGGLAAFAETAIVMAAAGPERQAAALTTCAAGLVGAAAWAQWVEGSSHLKRPFGFYGGQIAVTIACLLFPGPWTLLAAHCLAAPWMQSIGRLRCLVNGCCHGGPASDEIGIRVVDPDSRVTRLAGLTGVPIHPTPLYSILSNVALGLVVLRLWIAGCPMSVVCGVYLMGNGLARFVEEAYRGEPQTRVLLGLRFYQWIAVVSVACGALCTCLRSPAAGAFALSPSGWLLSIAFGLISAAALSLDFPESDRPLARLT